MGPNDKDNILEKFYKDGFVKLGRVLPTDMSVLNEEINKLLCEEPTHYKDYRPEKKSFFSPLIFNTLKQTNTSVIGKTSALDKILEKVFSKALFELIDEIGGINSKITTFHIRRADDKSLPNPLHQDSNGQFSLTILLNDVTPEMPTTNFFKGSHRFPVSIRDTLNPLSLKYLNGLMTPITGKTGDIHLFSNKIWHGMKTGNACTTVILITFDSEGFEHTLKNFGETTEYDQPFEPIIGSQLYQKLNDQNNLRFNSVQNLWFVKRDKGHHLIDKINSNPVFNLTSLSLSFTALTLRFVLSFTIKIVRALKSLKASLRWGKSHS